ncbi:hypothetical protein FQN53_009392 [Emmonsiellopsis sp. PD_33]|nr:hypothetical protein FQN53_009392 [Emmonsiellopsis sp. PD_33]
MPSSTSTLTTLLTLLLILLTPPLTLAEGKSCKANDFIIRCEPHGIETAATLGDEATAHMCSSYMRSAKTTTCPCARTPGVYCHLQTSKEVLKFRKICTENGTPRDEWGFRTCY